MHLDEPTHIRNDDTLVSDGIRAAFKKNVCLPSELYTKLTHCMSIDDSDILKLNIVLKRGLVMEMEDDSIFRSFLQVGDILLTMNDAVVAKSDFKMSEKFKDIKDSNCKMINFSYLHFRTYTTDAIPFENSSERRDGYDYRVAVMYSYQKMSLGLVLQAFDNRVTVVEAKANSIGGLCAQAGDIILHVCGKRVTDAEKAVDAITTELSVTGYAKVTLERASDNCAKAVMAYLLGKKENRDPPVAGDCLDYIDKAIELLTKKDPKSILRPPRSSIRISLTKVDFHSKITNESVIPSDIADDALIKTPDRVPKPVPSPSPCPSPAQSPLLESTEAADAAKKSPPANNSIYQRVLHLSYYFTGRNAVRKTSLLKKKSSTDLVSKKRSKASTAKKKSHDRKLKKKKKSSSSNNNNTTVTEGTTEGE